MTAKTATRPSSTAAAEQACRALQSEQETITADIVAAIRAGDADRALELRRRAEDLPFRARVAEVVMHTARMGEALEVIEEHKAALQALDGPFDAAREAHDSIELGSPGWRERQALAASKRDELERTARAANGLVVSDTQTINAALASIDRIIREETSRSSAPVVRSIIHAQPNGPTPSWG